MSVLQLFSPLARFIPEVEKPTFPIPFKQRAKWTIMCLFFFLICCQIPLVGVKISSSADPFSFLRTVLASNRGTLMELGISPGITASMIIQLFVGLGFVVVDHSVAEDVYLLHVAEKCLTLLITVAEAIVYIWSGMYGSPSELGFLRISLLMLQLIAASVIVMLLDELLQNGYGLGSGISLFLATNICETIIWKAFSPITTTTARGVEFEGAIVALFHLLITRSNPVMALFEAFTRSNLPNLTNLCATVLVFLIAIYCQNLHIDLPVHVRGHRGMVLSHTIKLFYTSNIPIILLSSCVSNISFLSRMLSRTFPNNLLVKILGTWDEINGQTFPKGGLAYYLHPPTSLTDLLYDPIHAFVYAVTILIACAFFSLLWLEISGMGPKKVYEQFQRSGREIAGFPGNATYKVLNHYIPTAAAFGGLSVGALTIFSDSVGAIGSGTGILLAANIISNYHEMLTKEKTNVDN